MIVRVFHGIQKDFPDWTKNQHLDKAAEYTGACKRTIETYLKQEKASKALEPPQKIQKQHPSMELDEHHKYLIRRSVHTFFHTNRIPTVNAMHAEIEKNEEISKTSRSKFYSILRELYFK